MIGLFLRSFYIQNWCKKSSLTDGFLIRYRPSDD